MNSEEKEDFKLLNNSYYRVDFTQRNKIIEFDGEYWHPDTNFDNTKDLFFKYKGFDVLRISENEYAKFPKETIEKCIKFLN